MTRSDRFSNLRKVAKLHDTNTESSLGDITSSLAPIHVLRVWLNRNTYVHNPYPAFAPRGTVRVTLVEVKVGFTTSTYVLDPEHRAKMGDFIIVPEDGGIDLGQVMSFKMCENVPSCARLPWTLSVVQSSSVLAIHLENETQFLAKVRKLLSSAFPDIIVLGIHLRLDMKKLVLIIKRLEKRVDFNGLTRFLFPQIKCRMWFEYDNEVKGWLRPPVYQESPVP